MQVDKINNSIKTTKLREADNSNTAVVAFGRMNPPTIGHNKLIDTMAAQSGDKKLYLSHTFDNKKNPLPYDQKLAYIDKAFGDRVEVVKSQAATVIQALQELYDQNYTNIIYVGGEDRIGGEEDITKTIERYNGQPDRQGNVLYKFDNIEFVNAGGRNSNSNDPIESASASKARELARNNDIEGFKAIVPFDDDTASDLFHDVRVGLSLEEALNEATFKYDDVNKHSYYTDFIDRFLTTGVRDKDGNILKADPEADKEALRAKLLDLQPEFKTKKDIFKNLVGQEWTKIDKAPFSGKGGEKGQSAGQHAEPLVCYLFNDGDISSVQDDYSKEWLQSSINSANVLKTNWNNKQFTAAHVDGDDINDIPDTAKIIASMFKSKVNAEQVLGLDKGTLNGLYSGGHKDDWCKADIILVNNKANVEELFKGVFNTETFNDAINAATDSNMIIPISLKGIEAKKEPHLEFVSNSTELDKPGELKIVLPKKELKSNDNNCSCWLMSNLGNIQFRRQSDTEDRLSIEVILSKAARGGKGVSKIQQQLNLGGNWIKTPIESKDKLIQSLRQITPNIEGIIPEGTEEYPGYNRTCFRGLVNLFKAYTNKFEGASAEDMFVWIMNNCVKSAVNYYKIS